MSLQKGRIRILRRWEKSNLITVPVVKMPLKIYWHPPLGRVLRCNSLSTKGFELSSPKSSEPNPVMIVRLDCRDKYIVQTQMLYSANVYCSYSLVGLVNRGSVNGVVRKQGDNVCGAGSVC